MQIDTDTLIQTLTSTDTQTYIHKHTETHSCKYRRMRAHSISPFSSAFTITRRQPKHSQVQACSGTVHSYSGTAGEPSACHPGTQIRQQDNTGGLHSGQPSPSASESYLKETQAREVWLGRCGVRRESMYTTHHQIRTEARDTAKRTQSTENHRKPWKEASSSRYTRQWGCWSSQGLQTEAPKPATISGASAVC